MDEKRLTEIDNLCQALRAGLDTARMNDGHAEITNAGLAMILDAMSDLRNEVTSTQSELAMVREELERVRWMPVDEALPEDGETVGFITQCERDPFYHGRILGGRFSASEFGGFSVPGTMFAASHWFRFPAIPESVRAALTPSPVSDCGPGDNTNDKEAHP